MRVHRSGGTSSGAPRANSPAIEKGEATLHPPTQNPNLKMKSEKKSDCFDEKYELGGRGIAAKLTVVQQEEEIDSTEKSQGTCSTGARFVLRGRGGNNGKLEVSWLHVSLVRRSTVVKAALRREWTQKTKKISKIPVVE